MFYNLRVDGNRNERLVMAEGWAEGCQTIVTNDRYNRIFPNWINSTIEGLGLNGERQFLAVEELFAHTLMQWSVAKLSPSQPMIPDVWP
jgi:hypothetical protein